MLFFKKCLNKDTRKNVYISITKTNKIKSYRCSIQPYLRIHYFLLFIRYLYIYIQCYY